MTGGAPDNGGWLGISDIARRMNMTRQSVSEAVIDYEAKGALETRRHGRRKFVRLGDYLRARGEVGDPSKQATAAPAPDDGDDAAVDPSYAKARAERERYAAENARIDLEERRGRLLQTQHVEHVAVEAGRRIRRELDRVVNLADELTSAAAAGGTPAVRQILKTRIRDIETLIAQAVASIAAAPEDE